MLDGKVDVWRRMLLPLPQNVHGLGEPIEELRDFDKLWWVGKYADSAAGVQKEQEEEKKEQEDAADDDRWRPFSLGESSVARARSSPGECRE